MATEGEPRISGTFYCLMVLTELIFKLVTDAACGAAYPAVSSVRSRYHVSLVCAAITQTLSHRRLTLMARHFLVLALSGLTISSTGTLATNVPARLNQYIFSAPPEYYGSSNWTAPPNVEATHHLIFQAASGLLQHWSNTAYPNGHSLSPGVIPVGTVLYHGTSTGLPSPTPDWISFDPEHAILFARGDKATLLAFTVTRPLKVLCSLNVTLRFSCSSILFL